MSYIHYVYIGDGLKRKGNAMKKINYKDLISSNPRINEIIFNIVKKYGIEIGEVENILLPMDLAQQLLRIIRCTGKN